MMQNSIVFGFNGFGRELSRVLSNEKMPFIVADTNSNNVNSALAFGYDARLVNIMENSELKNLGIGGGIDIAYCSLEDENENIFLVLSCRMLSNSTTIIAHAQTLDGKHKLLQAGATKIVDSYELSAHRIVDIITKPLIVEVMHSLLFEKSEIKVSELHIKEGSEFDGKSLHELDLKKSHNLIVLGVIDDAFDKKFLFSTKGYEHKLNSGDVLIVMGMDEDVERIKND